MAEFLQESIVFLVRVQCRRKESSRSLSHLLMSFLLLLVHTCYEASYVFQEHQEVHFLRSVQKVDNDSLVSIKDDVMTGCD